MKNFRKRIFFWGVGVGLVFFWWCFAEVLALCFGGLPKVFEQILLMSGLLFLKKILVANFCFLGVRVGHVFVGAVLLTVLLYVLAARSPKCLEKFS